MRRTRFELVKAEPADLQSAPFDRFGTDAFNSYEFLEVLSSPLSSTKISQLPDFSKYLHGIISI